MTIYHSCKCPCVNDKLMHAICYVSLGRICLGNLTFETNETIWFIILCIYFIPIHPPIYLTNYLFTYYPPTHYLPTYLLTYIFSFLYNLPTYLPTYLYIIYLHIHPLTYLSLTTRCSHHIYTLSVSIRF
jgi:VanZ family protein